VSAAYPGGGLFQAVPDFLAQAVHAGKQALVGLVESGFFVGGEDGGEGIFKNGCWLLVVACWTMRYRARICAAPLFLRCLKTAAHK
jgi:hypothetical protein